MLYIQCLPCRSEHEYKAFSKVIRVIIGTLEILMLGKSRDRFLLV